MTDTWHRWPVYLFLTVAFVATLPACSPDATRTERGLEEQALYVANSSEPKTLDPHEATGAIEIYIIGALYDGLVRKNPETLAIEPGVAERWDISKDGQVYTFYLRESQWSNGDALTASDFVSSWERALTPSIASQYAYLLYDIKNARQFNEGNLSNFSGVGVTAVDSYTLRIELERPAPYFLQLLDHSIAYPIHLPSLEKHGAKQILNGSWQQPGELIGNGAFVLSQWEPQIDLVVSRNSLYWEADSVRLNRIHFLPVDDKLTEERLFRTGQLHMTMDGRLALGKSRYYFENAPEKIAQAPYFGTYYYEFNVRHPALENGLLRRAMSLAIDREKICTLLLDNGSTPAGQFTPPGVSDYPDRQRFTHDPDAARKLLEQSGLQDSELLKGLQLLYNSSENHKKIALAAQQMWRDELGIDITLLNQEWKVYLDSRSNGNFEIARAGWFGDFLHPETFLGILTTHSGINRTGWSNSDYDALYAKALAQNDLAERYALLDQAEDILVADAPVAPICFESSVTLIHPAVKGIYKNALAYYPFRHVYLEH